MKYLFRNAAGDTREIEASMSSPPPEKVWIDNLGSWYPSEPPWADASRMTVAPGYVIELCSRVYTEPLSHTRFQPMNPPPTLRFKPGAV